MLIDDRAASYMYGFGPARMGEGQTKSADTVHSAMHSPIHTSSYLVGIPKSIIHWPQIRAHSLLSETTTIVRVIFYLGSLYSEVFELILGGDDQRKCISAALIGRISCWTTTMLPSVPGLLDGTRFSTEILATTESANDREGIWWDSSKHKCKELAEEQQ